jgi:hypothetical protein
MASFGALRRSTLVAESFGLALPGDCAAFTLSAVCTDLDIPIAAFTRTTLPIPPPDPIWARNFGFVWSSVSHVDRFAHIRQRSPVGSFRKNETRSRTQPLLSSGA